MADAPPPRERPVKQVIVIRRDLKMRRGKEIAQGAHAAMAWLTRRLRFGDDHACVELSAAEEEWLTTSFRKIAVTVSSEEQLMAVYDSAKAAGLVAELITDSGRTEFHGIPTPTSLGIGPDYDDLIDPVTGGLDLY
jgi:peptidyl-tRNA hydrolase, PTH2 family